MAENADRADPGAYCDAIMAAEDEAEKADTAKRFHLLKFEDDQQLVFGYASVAVTKNGDELEDLQGDVIDPESLEKAAYAYVLESREGRDMHGKAVVMDLVESLALTPQKLDAMGLVNKSAPQVALWVGFKVRQREDYLRVKRGERRMFSIRGTADARTV